MSTDSVNHTSEIICADLIRLLHKEAPAEDIFAQLARAEALPDDSNIKSALIESTRMAIAIRNRLELQQKREQGLLAVIESTQDLSGHLDLLGLLRAIVSRARNLLGSHMAWISVYNPDADELQVQVSDGAIFKDTDEMTTQKSFGMGSIIFSTAEPFSTSDYLSDNRFPHDPALDRIFKNEGISALVGVPLMSGNEVIGLLFVADRYHRSHTALEVSILCTLATHAAVAFKTTQAFDMTNTALKHADTAREELERHVQDIHSAVEAHGQLTSLLAQGASLKTLCATVAQLLDGHIVVVDEALQLISEGVSPHYTSLGGATYDPHGNTSNLIEIAIRESRGTGRSVVAYKDDKELCRVVSVIAGDDIVGAVLLFRKEDLNDVAKRTFERSSSVIGIGLLALERVENNKSRNAAMLLRGLLIPHEYEWASTAERAHQCHLDLSQSLSVLLVESDVLKSAYTTKRLRETPALANTALDSIDNMVAIVCNTDTAQEISQACTKLFVNELDANFWGVLSKPATKAEALPALYAALRRALIIAKQLNVKRILNQNELALYSVLFETHDRASLDGFLDASIGLLIEHDRERNSELTHTLLCHFDCNRNASLVAKRMNIHVNTVRQRLTRIEDMIGHLGNPTRALEVHMALRLWALSNH